MVRWWGESKGGVWGRSRGSRSAIRRGLGLGLTLVLG